MDIFENDMSVEEVFKRRQERRTETAESTNEEPQTELPTSEVEEEVVEASTEEVVEDTANPEEDIEDTEVEVEEDVEESEGSDEFDEDDDSELGEEEGDFYQIGDIEATLDEIKAWKEGHMRQADYTKKTQELSNQRKELEAQAENMNTVVNTLQEKAANLEVLINEVDEEIDWEDLKEYEPAEYLAQKEKQDKRKKALEELNGLKNLEEQNYIIEERNKLFAANPQWVENNQLTEAYNQDMTIIDGFLKSKDFTTEDVAQIKSHKVWNMILEIAKQDKSSKVTKSKEETLKKKVRKAPIVTKKHGKVAPKSGLKRDIEKARAKFKQTGDERDLMAVRKLERQLKK